MCLLCEITKGGLNMSYPQRFGQQLEKEVSCLEGRIDELEDIVEELLNRLDAMEKDCKVD